MSYFACCNPKIRALTGGTGSGFGEGEFDVPAEAKRFLSLFPDVPEYLMRHVQEQLVVVSGHEMEKHQ